MRAWWRNDTVRMAGVLLAVKGVLLAVGLLTAVSVPLSPLRYVTGYHHYAADPRFVGAPLDFFSLWAYGDGQWYLAIADRGYPAKEAFEAPAVEAPYGFQKYTERDGAMKYAFFPLFPLLVRLLHAVLPLGAAAFAAANLVSLAALLVVYRLVLAYGEDEAVAFRTTLLMALYPFGAFFQAVYADGLLLLLAASCFLFFARERYASSLLCGTLACLAKGMGLFLAIPLLAVVLRRRDALPRSALPLLAPLGLLPYMAFCFVQTGSWTFFNDVLARWGYEGGHAAGNLARNLTALFDLPSMEWLYFHSSRIDVLVMLGALALLAASWEKMPRELWLWAAVLWLVPMLRKDLMSFARYMAVSFPLFLFLARSCPSRRAFVLMAVFFALGAVAVHARLVLWFWVG